MKKYGNTNSEGLCTVKNPYKWPTIEWIKWNNENLGNLPLYAPSGDLVKDAENVEVEGPVWQFLSHDWTTGKNVQSWVDGNDGDKPFLTYNSYAKYWNERKFDTRQIYRLLTVPPTESDPSPMSSKGIKSAEAVLEATLDNEQSIESIVTAMHRYHAQFATEAGINDIEERLTEKTSSLKGCTKNEREYFIGGGEYVLSLLREAPSNNSSSEMVEKICAILWEEMKYNPSLYIVISDKIRSI